MGLVYEIIQLVAWLGVFCLLVPMAIVSVRHTWTAEDRSMLKWFVAVASLTAVVRIGLMTVGVM